MSADFTDRTDFEDASRGLIARLEPGVIKAADGRVVYDADVYTQTMAGDCPETVWAAPCFPDSYYGVDYAAICRLRYSS